MKMIMLRTKMSVSILGLVDKGLRRYLLLITARQKSVSILGLVDKGLRHLK